MPNIKQLLKAIENAADVTISKGGKAQVNESGPLIQKGAMAERPNTSVVIPEQVQGLKEDQQKFVLGNILARMNENKVGAKSPLADAGYESRSDVYQPDVAGVDYNEQYGNTLNNLDTDTSKLTKVDNEGSINDVIKMLMSRMQEESDITVSPNQMKSMLRDKNSSANNEQITNIISADRSGQDMQMPIEHETSMPRSAAIDEAQPYLQDRYKMIGNLSQLRDVMDAQKRFGVESGGSNIAMTGQNMQALNELGAFRNYQSKFHSPLLEELTNSIRASRTDPSMPTMQNSPSPNIDFGVDDPARTMFSTNSQSGMSDAVRKMIISKREMLGKSPETYNPNDSILNQLSDPNQVDQRLIDQQERVNEVIQLLSLMKQGKIAHMPNDTKLIRNLLTQEKGTMSALIKEILDEGK